MGKINSKDCWYSGMAAVLLSFVALDFLSSLGLLISGFILWLFYRKKRKEELAEERIKDLTNNALNMVNLVGKVFGNMVVEEKPRKTPRRKTTSRRIKRK